MILVTGASGTIGTHLVRALADAGARFRVGVHVRAPAAGGGGAVPIDFDRPATLSPALAGVETVFLLSQAIAHERALVAAAAAAGVRRIVKQSAWRAGAQAFTYGRRHRAIEREIEASGMAWTFLRPNSFMQNAVTYMGDGIRRDGAIYDSVGDARISHVDARDIARVAARVLTEPGHEGKAYDLSGPRALGHEELAAILSRALGRPIRYVRLDDVQFREGTLAAGVPEDEADALVDLNRYYRSGACAPVTPWVRTLAGRDPAPFEAVAPLLAPALAAVRDAQAAGGAP